MNSTKLYPSPIYGPVHSRRLGLSLGINLLPADGKICTFDCIYCECGFNAERPTRARHPSRQAVAQALEQQLAKMKEEGQVPDVLTFAGNGEPTSHPHFAEVIDDTIRLRDKYCPSARISVLSNATFAHRPDIREALLRVDNNILKLDTVSDDYIQRVDRPTQPSYNVQRVIEAMRSFNGHVIVQTIFMHGDGADNTSDEFVQPWLETLVKIKPQAVMVYTIDRPTPDQKLAKATPEELDNICERVKALGIDCTASY